MKYVAMSSWGGFEIEAYGSYIEGVREKLPPAVLLLLGEVDSGQSESLEGLTIRHMAADFQLSSFEIALGTVVSDISDTSQPKSLRLQYSGVAFVRSTADLSRREFVRGFGIHGYNEFEVLSDGLFEHRILFTSGIEIAVRFASMDIQRL